MLRLPHRCELGMTLGLRGMCAVWWKGGCTDKVRIMGELVGLDGKVVSRDESTVGIVLRA
jgi:hypothetical protein